MLFVKWFVDKKCLSWWGGYVIEGWYCGVCGCILGLMRERERGGDLDFVIVFDWLDWGWFFCYRYYKFVFGFVV